MISVEPDQAKLEQQSREQVLDAVRNGYNGEYITFSTPEQLFAALPPKRWVLIENTANETFANICLQSVQELKLPPIPEDVASTLPSEGLQQELTFILYAN